MCFHQIAVLVSINLLNRVEKGLLLDSPFSVNDCDLFSSGKYFFYVSYTLSRDRIFSQVEYKLVPSKAQDISENNWEPRTP